MTFEKATAQDTGMLTELRSAYLQEGFLCILVDRGKTYEPIIYYREDGDCFECLYEARV